MRFGTPKTAGPYGMEAALRLDFLSPDELAGQGVSLMPAAAPPAVNQGLVLDGATQYATVSSPFFTQLFLGGALDELSVFAEFMPTFAASESAYRMFHDGPVGARFALYKDQGSRNIRMLDAAASTIIDGDYATYAPIWIQNEKNRLAVTLKSGSNAMYLNGTLVGSSATAWARSPIMSYISIGYSIVSAPTASWFAGTFYDYRFYNRKLIAAEAVELTTVV